MLLGEPVVLCVECWFSDPEVTTKMSKADVAKKRNLTRRQFYPYFLQEGILLSTNLNPHLTLTWNCRSIIVWIYSKGRECVSSGMCLQKNE